MKIYQINKGVNKPLEVKGIKAQYLIYLTIGVIVLLMIYVISHLAGAPGFILLPAVGVLGFLLFTWVSQASKKYGEHGLMKAMAYRRVPSAILSSSRKLFFQLTENAINNDRSVSFSPCCSDNRSATN
ncbi:DUF4133 domain-containing protein [Chitinophaga silvisoli]|uniref:DUF4133 domain-containing protein n=1 Tax=Chitinophaga silvisoli TaxID=2291814 RepID=A0A3E1P3J4_9BACT|nr:DUF4133 domain-containing protein [Chitinophaga silvisoli]RFM34741.1 DUF4133 domain-containing protein [Chitinophaga silvisoli]